MFWPGTSCGNAYVFAVADVVVGVNCRMSCKLSRQRTTADGGFETSHSMEVREWGDDSAARSGQLCSVGEESKEL
jgi:hypothetical protein